MPNTHVVPAWLQRLFRRPNDHQSPTVLKEASDHLSDTDLEVIVGGIEIIPGSLPGARPPQ